MGFKTTNNVKFFKNIFVFYTEFQILNLISFVVLHFFKITQNFRI